MAASDMHLKKCNRSSSSSSNNNISTETGKDNSEKLKDNSPMSNTATSNIARQHLSPQSDSPRLLCQPAPPVTMATGQLLMIRHGQSNANAIRELSGWQDADLTSIGEAQARSVAKQLAERNWSPDIAFCSVLQRALKTCRIICGHVVNGDSTCPIETSWQLNEQMYGSLMGCTQQRGLLPSPSTRPPPLLRSDPRWPGHEAKYAGVPSELLPEAESCMDAFDRVSSYFSSRIAPQVVAGRRVLWVGHGGVFCTFILQTIGRNVRFENCHPYLLELDCNGWPVSIESWF